VSTALKVLAATAVRLGREDDPGLVLGDDYAYEGRGTVVV
jgi:hypothetical protein